MATENFRANDLPAINTHVVLADTITEIPPFTGYVVGFGVIETSASRGLHVLVHLDAEWTAQFTGPCTVSVLPIRPEYLQPLEES